MSVDLLNVARSGTVHFVGIGGAGMCALAELLVRGGGRVSGCDLDPGPETERLEALGVDVAAGHDPAHLTGVDALVVSAAIPTAHPELVRARELDIPVLKRAEALGEVVNRGRVVAVAGTHGKTSTTAMATEIMAAAGLDPTGFVGGTVRGWEGNLRYGRDDLFVVEADEYDRSFHTLEPDVAVVTNVEADHLDVYGDLEGVRAGFRRFLEAVRPKGRVAICADDPEASRLVAGMPVEPYSYGFAAGAQLRATEVRQTPEGTLFRVFEEGVDRGELRLGIPGRHNLLNALGATAAARHLGVTWREVADALATYGGVGRRFQLLGEVSGVAVIDDYAHHPTEIDATLSAARAVHPDRRLVAVFQPHLFSRTRDFADAFGRALSAADQVWVTDVYPAREKPVEGVTGELVVDAVRAADDVPTAGVRYHPDLDGLADAVAGSIRPGDVVVVMGAGTVDRVGPELVRRLEGTS